MAKDINPDLSLEVLEEPVEADNAASFLQGADLYVDGLDFFALEARRAVFAACHRMGIPAVTAAPLGLGSALLTFLPGRMDFERYFCLEGLGRQDQLIRFLIGLAPAMLHRGYLVEPSVVDLGQERVPSTPVGCELAAGWVGAETLKLLLGRGRVRPAPWAHQFDAYRNRLAHTWRPGGNHHPLQRIAFRIARRQLEGRQAAS